MHVLNLYLVKEELKSDARDKGTRHQRTDIDRQMFVLTLSFKGKSFRVMEDNRSVDE